MSTVGNIGEMYEAGLFVEDFTTFLATAPQMHGSSGSQPAPARLAGSPSTTSPSPIPPRAPRPCTVCRSKSKRAKSLRWLANGSGKTHWRNCSPGCTCRKPA